MSISDGLFKKIEKKTKVDKDTTISLATKLQNGNMKDPKILEEIINTLSTMTGKKVSKETKEKIISKIVNDEVPKGVEKMF